MTELVKQGIAKKESATTQLFDNLIKGETFMTINYKTPKEYVQRLWMALENANKPTLYDKAFEYMIYTLLYREGIKPFYTHVRITDVPLVSFDILLFNQSAPVSLSLKTSFRERYKQADLEAIALKYVHRKAQCYLLTLDDKEAKTTRAKIPNGLLIGLDDVIDCNTKQIDDLIEFLKQQSFVESQQIEVVTGNLVKKK